MHALRCKIRTIPPSQQLYSRLALTSSDHHLVVCTVQCFWIPRLDHRYWSKVPIHILSPTWGMRCWLHWYCGAFTTGMPQLLDQLPSRCCGGDLTHLFFSVIKFPREGYVWQDCACPLGISSLILMDCCHGCVFEGSVCLLVHSNCQPSCRAVTVCRLVLVIAS